MYYILYSCGISLHTITLLFILCSIVNVCKYVKLPNLVLSAITDKETIFADH